MKFQQTIVFMILLLIAFAVVIFVTFANPSFEVSTHQIEVFGKQKSYRIQAINAVANAITLPQQCNEHIKVFVRSRNNFGVHLVSLL